MRLQIINRLHSLLYQHFFLTLEQQIQRVYIFNLKNYIGLPCHVYCKYFPWVKITYISENYKINETDCIRWALQEKNIMEIFTPLKK